MIIRAMVCDRCGRVRQPRPIEPDAITRDIRRLAYQEGWDVGSPKDFDICPRCWMAILDEEAHRMIRRIDATSTGHLRAVYEPAATHPAGCEPTPLRPRGDDTKEDRR